MSRIEICSDLGGIEPFDLVHQGRRVQAQIGAAVGMETCLYPEARSDNRETLDVLSRRIDCFPVVLILVAPVSKFDVEDTRVVARPEQVLCNEISRAGQAGWDRDHWD